MEEETSERDCLIFFFTNTDFVLLDKALRVSANVPPSVILQ